MRRFALFALCLALPAAPAALTAQQMVASATLPVASPTGGGSRNLLFGSVTALGSTPVNVSVPAAVNPLSATVQSGEFRFDVGSTAGLEYTLGLPAVLTSTIGSATLPISFAGAQYGAHCTESGSTGCTPASFDPAGSPLRVCAAYNGTSGTCKRASIFPLGTRYRIFLGGAITVAPAQPAATYVGTVTLTITQVY